MQFYDIRDTMKESPNTRLFYIIGQRGVGKTYSAKKYVIEKFLKKNKRFIYVRRWTTEVQGKELASVFSDVMSDREVQEWLKDYDSDDKYHRFHIMPKSGEFWLIGEKENGTLDWLDVVGKITCIARAEQFKGGSYLEYPTIIFDEFITELGYKMGDKEVDLFAKIVNSVGRIENRDLIIIMAGNPDSSIEACPYLYNLMLDYAHMQANTVYHYDTKTPSGKILANNVAFIKLANFSGENIGYLNEYTSNLWMTAEEAMSASGEVKTENFIICEKNTFPEGFEPLYQLTVETPVFGADVWHKRIYVYYGIRWNESMCVIFNHEVDKLDARLYCRYDKTDLRRREERQTFRVNIPPEPAFSDLRSIMACVDCNQFYITDDLSAATLYQQIRLNG